MSGATTLAFGLSLVTTNLGGGYIAESAGYLPLFLVTACLTAAGGLLFWAYFGAPRGLCSRALARGASACALLRTFLIG